MTASVGAWRKNKEGYTDVCATSFCNLPTDAKTYRLTRAHTQIKKTLTNAFRAMLLASVLEAQVTRVLRAPQWKNDTGSA